MGELSDEERARRLAALDRYIAKENAKPANKRKLSSAAVKTDTGPACPKCGGTQFKGRRSNGRRVGLGVLSLLASQNQVECVACGARYVRG